MIDMKLRRIKKMNNKLTLLFNAYLYRGKTAVDKKEIIRNSTDDDYENIALYLSEDFIEEAYRMLQMTRKAIAEGMVEL